MTTKASLMPKLSDIPRVPMALKTKLLLTYGLDFAWLAAMLALSRNLALGLLVAVPLLILGTWVVTNPAPAASAAPVAVAPSAAEEA